MKQIPLCSFLLLILFLGNACNKEENNSDDCSGNICTTDFRIITVSVSDASSNPVALDSFEVIDVSNGEIVTPSESTFSFQFAQEQGAYPLVTDGSIPLNQTRVLQFKGFLDSNLVVDRKYIAEEACCGVNLLEGDLTVTIQ